MPVRKLLKIFGFLNFRQQKNISITETPQTFSPIQEKEKQDIWITREGKVIPLSYMSDRHLLNAINMLKRHLVRLENKLQYRRENSICVLEANNPYYQTKSIPRITSSNYPLMEPLDKIDDYWE